ncbi:SRF family protein [Megaselia abdita]
MSSGNETDDSSDVESPGPLPSANQTVLVENSPPKPMGYYDNFKVTPSTSHNPQQQQQQHNHQQQQQQHHHHQQQHPTTSQNTTSQLPQNLSPEVLLGLVHAGHLPQDVLLKLVQSGELQLHTEEGGQYITIPIPVASTSSKAGSSNKNNNRKGGGGGSGSSTYIKKEASD